MPDHGPDCIACSDPAEAARQIAAERAELDAEAERARAHRAAGETARQEYLRPGQPAEQFAEAQALMLHHLGTANAISSGVMFARAHLQRVEDSHPRRTMTVSVQGGLL